MKGFTEPDPRDDLSGMDVARKLTILARELGQEVEIGDFPVQIWCPRHCAMCSIEEFLDRCSDYDDEIKPVRAAQAAGKKLRYVGDWMPRAMLGRARVGRRDHPFSNINLTDNIVQFETTRYSANPWYARARGRT